MNSKDVQLAPPRSGRRIISALFFGVNAQILAFLSILALGRLLFYDRTIVFVLINTFTAYVYLPAYFILLVGLVARRKYLAIVAGGIVVFHLLLFLPSLIRANDFGGETAVGESIRLFSANLNMFNHESEAMFAEIEQVNADVLLFQEYTLHWDEAFSQSQLVEAYPYHLIDIGERSFGTAIWSKRPLQDTEIWLAEQIYLTSATIEISGQPIRLHNMHPMPPQYSYGKWDPMMDTIRQRLVAEPIPVIAMGDFNMGPYNKQYQALLNEGLRNVHEELGQTMATTWPNGRLAMPPVRLDHVFISSGIIGLSISEGVGVGSDHKPVIVDLALASSP